MVMKVDRRLLGGTRNDEKVEQRQKTTCGMEAETSLVKLEKNRGGRRMRRKRNN